MAKNRGDLLTKVAELFSHVGIILGQAERWVKCFPSTHMVTLTSKLYAAVLEFLQEVIAHFQRHPVREYRLRMAKAEYRPLKQVSQGE